VAIPKGVTEYVRTEDLPTVISGAEPQAVAGDHDAAVSSGKLAEEFGVFHGDTPHKHIVIPGKEGPTGNAKINSSIPADVMTGFNQLP